MSSYNLEYFMDFNGFLFANLKILVNEGILCVLVLLFHDDERIVFEQEIILTYNF